MPQSNISPDPPGLTDDLTTMDDMASSRKQLPLRPQRQRPILKYSSNNKNLADTSATLNQRNSSSRGARSRPSSSKYTTQRQTILGSYLGVYSDAAQANYNYAGYHSGAPTAGGKGVACLNSGTFQLQPQLALSNYLFLSGAGTPGGATLTPAQILASNIQTSVKVNNKNPYTRPLSAKDIQQSAPVEKPQQTNCGNFAPVQRSSSVNSLNSNSSSTAAPSSTSIQTNVFMRPQSAVPSEPPSGTSSKVTSRSTTPKRSPPHAPAGTAFDLPDAAAQARTTMRSALESTKTVTFASSTDGEPPKDYEEEEKIMMLSSSTRPPLPRPPSGTRPISARSPAKKPTVVAAPTTSGVPPSLITQSLHRGNSGLTAASSQKQVDIDSTANRNAQQAPTRTNSKNLMIFQPSATMDFTNMSIGSTNSTSKPCSAVVVSSNTSTAQHVRQQPLQMNIGSTFRSVPTKAKPSLPSSRDSSFSRTSPSPIRPGTPAADAASKVRNLNYTPSKPYSEVSDQLDRSASSDDSPDSSEYGGKKTVVGDPDRKSNTTTNAPPGDELRKQSNSSKFRSVDPDMIKDGSVKKMPVTNTLTGTVFYRKSSKSEEVVQNARLRPQADGAPDRLRPSDKAADSDGEEWEDDDDDSGNGDPDSERVPGDGEDDDDDDDDTADDVNDDDDDDDEDDDDDDGIDGLDDDVDSRSDDGSDTYSITASAGPSRQASAHRVRSATTRLSGLSVSDAGSASSRTSSIRSRPASATSQGSTTTELQPALMPSLFPNVPPTVNFVIDGQKIDALPWEFRRLLKWRMSPITPNVVKHCIARSGFRATKKNHDWLGYWGKHMKAPGFKSIREYQKINHFPGSFQIGRKDRLWRNLSRFQVHFGKREFGFFPQTFVLPFDTKQLKRQWDEGGNKQKWIIKPPASARGIGIKVIHKWNQIPKKRPVIVQRYLGRPYLINESKFDLRIYVYVTSYDPLRIYVYDDGLVRFASVKYSYAMKSLANKYMHLTNYSINKRNNEYESNTDENVCQGHKWGLKALWGYMKKRGINTSAVWESIKDLVIKTIISSEACVNSMVKSNVRRPFCCHELFGFDVMLDDDLKPWIIEVNISPSLHSNSQLDMNIKGGLIKDLMNLAGFMLPDKVDVVPTSPPTIDSRRYVPPHPLCIDHRLWPSQAAPDERAKHAYYCQRHQDQAVQATILDVLSPHDVRTLRELVDEDSRRGNFQRIFPSTTSHKYMRFFEVQRYCNLVCDAWLNKYTRSEARGIALLEKLCAQNVHLDNPTEDPKHQWVPPSSIRDPRSVVSAPAASQAKGALPNLKKKLGAKNLLGSASSLGSAMSQYVTSSRPPTARSAGIVGSGATAAVDPS